MDHSFDDIDEFEQILRDCRDSSDGGEEEELLIFFLKSAPDTVDPRHAIQQILDTESWPWPLFFAVTGPKGLGVLTHDEGQVRPIVYLANLFSLASKADLQRCEKVVYADVQSLVGDGWRPD